jgi:hypothetical protein
MTMCLKEFPRMNAKNFVQESLYRMHLPKLSKFFLQETVHLYCQNNEQISQVTCNLMLNIGTKQRNEFICREQNKSVQDLFQTYCNLFFYI